MSNILEFENEFGTLILATSDSSGNLKYYTVDGKPYAGKCATLKRKCCNESTIPVPGPQGPAGPMGPRGIQGEPGQDCDCPCQELYREGYYANLESTRYIFQQMVDNDRTQIQVDDFIVNGESLGLINNGIITFDLEDPRGSFYNCEYFDSTIGEFFRQTALNGDFQELKMDFKVERLDFENCFSCLLRVVFPADTIWEIKANYSNLFYDSIIINSDGEHTWSPGHGTAGTTAINCITNYYIDRPKGIHKEKFYFKSC